MGTSQLHYPGKQVVPVIIRKLHPSADGIKYIYPQSNNIQRVRAPRTLSPKRDVSIKFFPHGLRELCRKGG